MKEYLAMIVLLLGVSAYQSRESVEYLYDRWLGIYEQRLEPLVHKLPTVRLEYDDGIIVSVKRGHSQPID